MLVIGLLSFTAPVNETGAQNAVHEDSAAEQAQDATSASGAIELTQTLFPIRQWRADGSHLTTVRGKLVYDGQPVADAVLQVDPGKKEMTTALDGSFEWLVDRSLLARIQVQVKSAERAVIGGRPIGREAADRLAAASKTIQVYHPIEVLRVETDAADASRVRVHARIASESGEEISFFRVDRYRIGGTVTDADGKPLEGAIVWIDRDGGEGFAKSTPTDRSGAFEMFYWPEEEETNLTVVVGSKRYTLPENKVFILPRHTSVEIHIRLPAEGTTIDDKPPFLVARTAKGAMYSGVLAGLNAPGEEDCTVTIPDREGRFVLTAPRRVWARQPEFFETRVRKFVDREKILRAGDDLPQGFLQPGVRDPVGIVPERRQAS